MSKTGYIPPKKKGNLRVLFWNVQDWGLRGGDLFAEQRFGRIMAVLRREKPDIALFAEIIDSTVTARLAQSLRGHTVFQTNGRNPRELVAVFRHAAGRSVQMEQRNEFSNDTLTERTFPLLRVTGRDFGKIAVLGLHTKSGSNPESLARRQRTLGHIGRLQATLAKEGTPLLALGDMNTMGDGDKVDAAREIGFTTVRMAAMGMTALPADHPHSWHGIGRDAHYPDCRLDHAFLSKAAQGRVCLPAPMRIGGWPDKAPGRQRDEWVRRYSDHAYLVVDLKP